MGEIPPGFDNGLRPPRKLAKRQQWLWDRYIRTASWLKPHDETKALMWCELYEQFEREPDRVNANMITQIRALGSELGLDPGSRSRIGAAADIPKSKFDGLIGGRPKE